jgi:hypothetical protein
LLSSSIFTQNPIIHNSRPKCFSETAYLEVYNHYSNCRSRIRTKYKLQRL